MLATALCLLASTAAFAEDPLPRAKPEEVGLSSERLARIGATLKADIEAGRIPGAVIAIARHGKLVAFDAYGWRDKAAGVAMTTDTIFNIASMTKPMTTVGALMLYEQGKLLIDDPLAKYFPKFANMRVAVRDANGEPTAETVPANRQITIQDLMRHTSGLIYGGRGNTLVHKMYPAGSGDAARDYDGAAFLDKLASLPLLYQPATVWDYGFGLDVLGLTIEKVSRPVARAISAGQPVRAARHDRHRLLDFAGQGGALRQAVADRSRHRQAAGAQPRTDPAAQIRMRRRLRRLDRVRLSALCHDADEWRPLRRSAPARPARPSTTCCPTSSAPNIKNLVGNADPTRADYGFGLGLAVRTTPGVVRMMGSVGQFSWPGASGTDWWADPKEDLAVVYLSAAPGPIRWHYRQKINALVYQAIVE